VFSWPSRYFSTNHEWLDRSPIRQYVMIGRSPVIPARGGRGLGVGSERA
jgi:hypothetical protein